MKSGLKPRAYVSALWLTLSARRGYHAALVAKRSLNRSQIRCRREILMTLYCPECETTYEGDEYELCPADGSRLFQLSALQKKGDPLLGKIIDDRFRVEKMLGAGGMGAVYVGTQLSVRREVAIKVLRPELADREMMLERFFREAKVVSELTHPNIVRLVEFGQDQELDLLYLVMELVRGTDLGDLLKGGRLRTNLALEVVYQVCGALTEPHARGIVHRDLKPENLIMMPISDGTLQVKVLDFGIARALEGGTQLTKTGMVCGTPSYMAPEQAQNEGLDGRTDLYALGVILYEMMMGQPPFVGESGLQILLKHIQREAPRLSEMMPVGTVPDEVSELVEQLLAKSPEHRPESARAVRDRIDQIRSQLKLRPVRLDVGVGEEDPFDAWVLPRIANKGISKGGSEDDLPLGLDELNTGGDLASPRSTDELDSQETQVHQRRQTDKEFIGAAETLTATPSGARPAMGSGADRAEPAPAGDKSGEQSSQQVEPRRTKKKKESTQVVAASVSSASPGETEAVMEPAQSTGGDKKLVAILVVIAAVGVLAMTVVAGVLVYQLIGDADDDRRQADAVSVEDGEEEESVQEADEEDGEREEAAATDAIDEGKAVAIELESQVRSLSEETVEVGETDDAVGAESSGPAGGREQTRPVRQMEREPEPEPEPVAEERTEARAEQVVEKERDDPEDDVASSPPPPERAEQEESDDAEDDRDQGRLEQIFEGGRFRGD